MKILYLTSSIASADFALLEEKASVKPNPAGQNFHQRLIHALAKFAEVHVFSLIPNREMILEENAFEEDGIHYTYINPVNGKIQQVLFGTSNIAKRLDGEFDVVIYGSLSLTLASASKTVAKKANAVRVAVCTDSPFNITGANSFYQKQVLSLSSKAEGYFCLTHGLDSLFNKNGKPCLIKPGIAERIEVLANPHPRPYFYYGGALFIKDGTEALINAYEGSNADYDLVIAGHGNYEEEVKRASMSDPRIRFLGQISKKENAAYEANADLLINPRLYRKELDEVSIPSKLLEYLALGRRIVSAKSSDLQTIFEDEINWLEDGSELSAFLNAHLDESGKLYGIKENTGKEKVLDLLGFEAIGRDFTEFLQKLVRP